MTGNAQVDQLIRELDDNSRRAESFRAAHAAGELLHRPDERRWSAAECVEHLNLSNRGYLPRIDEATQTLRERKLTAGGPFRPEWNARLLRYWLEPPSRIRVATPAPFRPVAVEDAAVTFGEFVAINAQLKTRLETGRGLDLSAVKVASLFAENVKYSVYSAFVLIAAHNRRHLWQAERALSAVRRA